MFEMWSAPRMTCVIASSMSSTGLAKLYVGRPSERTRTRSSSCSLGNSTRPSTASSQPVTPSSGMRKRIAPSSSYAFLSATSCSASPRQRSIASSWKRTGPSQSMPSQASDRWICSTDSATSRLVSVFSIRSRDSPPRPRAKSQLKRNVRTPPMCRNPVGDGAMRTRTAMGVRLLRRHEQLEQLVAVALDLDPPEALDRSQLVARLRLYACEGAQGRVVEDDVRRDAVLRERSSRQLLSRSTTAASASASGLARTVGGGTAGSTASTR